ncbi:MAG: hypothetical protein PQJ46_09335 [Spirochaetales bacterium]|nr:hypothetical protein [Spirochaetales bacterium]
MAEFKVYTNAEEAKAIRAYAKADHRSISNSFLHAFAGQVARTKKKDNHDKIISWPDESL